MSAFVVGTDHIDAMITAAIQLSTRDGGFRWYRGEVSHQLDHTNEDEVGAMLLAENVRSVNYRYTEQEPTPAYVYRPWFPGAAPGSINFRETRRLVVLFKAIACYEYQSCETPDWGQSSAHAFCRALKEKAIRALPGYEDAAGWELRRPSQPAPEIGSRQR